MTITPRSGIIIALTMIIGVLIVNPEVVQSSGDSPVSDSKVADFLGLSGTTSPWLMSLALFLLPIAWFPISVLLILSGVVFGTVNAIVLTTAATSFHLLVSFALTRSFFRGRVLSFLRGRGYHEPSLPPKYRIPVTFFFFLMPGLPYGAKNYLFAFTDVPFFVYFWVALPVYVFYNVLYIVAGDAAVSSNWGVLAGIISLTVAVGLVLRALKSRLGVFLPELGQNRKTESLTGKISNETVLSSRRDGRSSTDAK
jgi:uncharacterized membrane protein YdjX (TVP38/TMEM64 family)